MVYRYVVDIEYPGAGAPGINQWHMRAEPNTSARLDLVIEVLENFYAGVMQLMAPGVVVRGRTDIATDIEGDDPGFLNVAGFELSQTAGGRALPPANALCLTWRTASRTRSGRGRTFLGPLNTGTQDADGTPLTSVLDEVGAAAQALLDVSTDESGSSFGVWSPTQNLFRDFTGYSLTDQFAVLRSRRD